MRNFDELAASRTPVDKRIEARLLCSDLADVYTADGKSWKPRGTAVVEDVSQSGVCIQLHEPLPNETVVRLCYPAGELKARVCYCAYRDSGYFIGLKLDTLSRWSFAMHRTRHLLDPRNLLRK